MEKISLEDREAILVESIRTWARQRRERITDFVDRHFGFKGAWDINKKGFGKDQLKAPVNMLWSVPVVLAKGSGWIAGKIGPRGRKVKAWINRIWPGFETKVGREILWLVQSEFFELPYEQGSRRCERDSLLEAIMAHPRLSEAMYDDFKKIHAMSADPDFRGRLEQMLREYGTSRDAVSEIAGSLLTVAAGAVAFHKFTPGAVEAGTAAAAATAQAAAISGCWAGQTLGGLYYGLFPAAPSLALSAATTGGILVLLGVVTAISGIVTDPVQKALGLHQRRLRKLVNSAENSLCKAITDPREQTELVLYERYLTRVFDLVDLLASI